jgi:dTDP-4-amino-4,6-dideoxygalactose transaminase
MERERSGRCTSPVAHATWTSFVRSQNETTSQSSRDCAHAIEAEYHGRKVGTFGGFGCFRFYVTKNVVTGEGGMILTNDEKAADRLKTLALHGLSRDAWKRFSDEGCVHYSVVDCGFKHNMMDLQAALGIHQMARVEANWILRREIWERYDRASADLPLIRPSIPESGTRHAYHLYTVLIGEGKTGVSRDEFLRRMTRSNIGVGVHYVSLPEHPFYQERFGWRPEDYPEAARVGRQTVSLPLSAKLTDADVDDVINAVGRALS